MPNIGPVELVIILVIALLVIGPGKLPEVGSALGKSIREFRKAATDVQESVKLDAPIAPVPTPAPIAPVPTPAPIAPVVATTAGVVAAPTAAAPAPNTLAAAATPNELSAPAAPDPAATAADAATEARV
jgi:TatA/E family protein of Tat protein translocase